ncbi:2,4-dihydroxyhept-2-ene-1,7-dioic acid aldolase [Pseudoclavibacter sp. CFCC 13796]|uniref:HpcH/HpaI aldolase family protein n=1 Tax=Pseudoclavibacter sp. CFCC 14310 TaxID=2615180 RepID=UPI001300FC54|nr:aldolase/citrate lyase family protein [Pseudoclavibacter sp. CFCC 14310]KAB1644336.1 2,4-dihydroxyhept-2-ene-1,7-dioic acid aldolase [Pseudoclavibacter sp. CFCC 14310]KAB1661057.1 2,4-dihydroxyhept-2-ene-1,7-dioic acid aldolase [Pseudoclavibacter sp. CFCC 13796]KAB1664162.1 2,4-dihydroxyhept-2-ene-1,7-dioic acid aldolase [Pseudoclavibacter sp. CFCC 13611]
MSAARVSPLTVNAELKQRFARGETTVGLFIGLGSTMAAEVVAASGADWLLADLEHGGGDESQIGDIVTAAAAYGVPTLVRVETPERIRVGRVLDSGAAGVMLPRITSAEQVAEARRGQLYPPEGIRGVASYNRAARWGQDREALDRANDDTITVVQIETLAALETVDEIAAQPGVDVLFVGPLDLSYALGVPRQFDAPVFQEALDRVLEAGRQHGVSVGILAANLEAARAYQRRGFTFLTIGSDSTLLAQAVHDTVTGLREQS